MSVHLQDIAFQTTNQIISLSLKALNNLYGKLFTVIRLTVLQKGVIFNYFHSRENIFIMIIIITPTLGNQFD